MSVWILLLSTLFHWRPLLAADCGPTARCYRIEAPDKGQFTEYKQGIVIFSLIGVDGNRREMARLTWEKKGFEFSAKAGETLVISVIKHNYTNSGCGDVYYKHFLFSGANLIDPCTKTLIVPFGRKEWLETENADKTCAYSVESVPLVQIVDTKFTRYFFNGQTGEWTQENVPPFPAWIMEGTELYRMVLPGGGCRSCLPTLDLNADFVARSAE